MSAQVLVHVRMCERANACARMDLFMYTSHIKLSTVYMYPHIFKNVKALILKLGTVLIHYLVPTYCEFYCDRTNVY